MLDKEDRQILITLLQASEPLSSEALSFQNSMSSKTIRRRLEKMVEILQENGANLIRKKGTGIYIQIQDQTLFDTFKQHILLESETYTNDRLHLRELISILLSHSDYQKADDLADLLFVSKSKLTQMLNEVRGILDTYDLTIQAKPYYGLKIEGSEFNFRRFIASQYAQNYNEYERYDHLMKDDVHYDDEMYKKVYDIVKQQIQTHQYHMPSNIFTSFVTHLYIVLLRLEKDLSISWETSVTSKHTNKKEKAIVKGIIEQIEEQFQIQVPVGEYNYLLIHLASKKVMDISESENIPDEINGLVEKILLYIEEATNIDLINDLDLRIMLGLHLVPLLTRLHFQIELKNPILEDVKTQCVAGYDLAILCARVIEEKTKATLSEHEISYFALHFDVALNRNSECIRKKNILVVCSSGRASAQLLKIKFENLFSTYMESIHVCDVNDVQMHLLDGNYDYIFTTIPYQFDTSIPVFEFQFFLNSDSVEMIRSVLHSDARFHKIVQYFRPEMFLGVCNFTNKEEIISYMVKQIRKVKHLPETFEELVLQRESVCGTDIMPSVALPHPNQVITEDTFISVLILKKPILWNRNKIRMVFMISISRKDSEKYKFLFEWIIDLLSNAEAVKRIIEQGTYTSLQQELLQLQGMKEN